MTAAYRFSLAVCSLQIDGIFVSANDSCILPQNACFSRTDHNEKPREQRKCNNCCSITALMLDFRGAQSMNIENVFRDKLRKTCHHNPAGQLLEHEIPMIRNVISEEHSPIASPHS